MTWARLDDSSRSHPKVYACGATAVERKARLGAWVGLLVYASAYGTDGFVDAGAVAVAEADEGDLAALRAARRIHGRRDRCRCWEGRTWPPGAVFVIHDFLVYNPTRAETDVAKAKRKELRDPVLRQAVRDRDGGLCRYCGIEVNYADRRSPTGGVMEHVDPERAAGAPNLATACRSCNGRKNCRTPEQAGMRLWPVGHTMARIARAEAAEAVAKPVSHGEAPGHSVSEHDSPKTDQPQNQKPIRNGSSDREQVRRRSVFDPATGPPRENQAVDTPPVGMPSPDQTNDGRTDGPGRVGSGRVAAADPDAGDAGPEGHRSQVGPPPRRTDRTLNPHLLAAHQPRDPPGEDPRPADP